MFSRFGLSKTDLLVPLWMMAEDNYPLPQKGMTRKGYRYSKIRYDIPSASSPLFAIDCEMCVTSEGHELTKVAIVDENHEPVYESFVKPQNKIIDYISEYSGITSEMLDGVTVRLVDVQNFIKQCLPSDAILVGHGFSNDLMALKIYHPFVIDTSIIYNRVPGKKMKLKQLAKIILNETIKDGYICPLEDSITAMKLVQLRLRRDICYGDAFMFQLAPIFYGNTHLGRLSYNNEHLLEILNITEDNHCAFPHHSWCIALFSAHNCWHLQLRYNYLDVDSEPVSD